MGVERAEIVLPARGRFDLRATVLSHGHEALAPFRWHDGARPFLERAEELPGGVVYHLTVRPTPGGVVLRVTGEDASEIEALAPLAARVRRSLDLDLDLAPFHRLCRGDPLLRSAVPLGLGRLLRGTSLFEDLVRSIARATRIDSGRTTAALAALGRRCPVRPELRAFPSPRALARLDVRKLAGRTGLGHRAAWVSALARDADTARLDLDAVARLPGPRLASRLARIPGVGRLTLARLLLLLGKHDCPVLDRAALGFAARAFGPAGPAGSTLESWVARRQPWGGLALWCAQALEVRAGAGPGADRAALRKRRGSRAPDRRGARSRGRGTHRPPRRGARRPPPRSGGGAPR